jgi:hypothetical protein
MVCNFVSRKEISQRLSMSATTLKRYRLSGHLIEGIHWVRLNSRCIRYNFELTQDWVQNRGNGAVHERAIALYQASLLSNQPLPKGRPKSLSARN